MRKFLTLLLLMASACFAQSKTTGTTGKSMACTGGPPDYCSEQTTEAEPLSLLPAITTGPNNVTANVPPLPAQNGMYIDPFFGNRVLRISNSSGTICSLTGHGHRTNSSAGIPEASLIDPTTNLYSFYLVATGNTLDFYSFNPQTFQVGGPYCIGGAMSDGGVAFEYAGSGPRAFFASNTTFNPGELEEWTWPAYSTVGSATEQNRWNVNDAADLNGLLNAVPTILDSAPPNPSIVSTSGGSLNSYDKYIIVSYWDVTTGQESPPSNAVSASLSGTCPSSGNCSIIVTSPGGSSTTCGLSTSDTIEYQTYVGDNISGSNNAGPMQSIGLTACSTNVTISTFPTGGHYIWGTCASGCAIDEVTASADGQNIGVMYRHAGDEGFIAAVYNKTKGWRWLNTVTGQIGQGTGWGATPTGAASYSYYPTNGCAGYLQHETLISVDGNYMFISPQADCGNWGSAPNGASGGNTGRFIWYIPSLDIQVCGFENGNNCGGHYAMGYGAFDNDTATDSEFDQSTRSLVSTTNANIGNITILTPNTPGPLVGHFAVDEHPAWNAVSPVNCGPVFRGVTYFVSGQISIPQPINNLAFENEDYAVDPCNIQTTYRFVDNLMVDFDEASLGFTVTGATGNGVSPIVLTLSSTAQLVTGTSVLVTNVGGNTAANGIWKITVSGNTISLTGSTGNGTWTSGGSVSQGGPCSGADFNTTLLAGQFPDGKFALFTSNWGATGTSGVDMLGCIPGGATELVDTFLVQTR